MITDRNLNMTGYFWYVFKFILCDISKGGDTMARRKMPKRRDKKIFKRTAVATRKINLSPAAMRGGIRL